MSIQAYDINLAPAGSQGSTQIIESTAQICDFLSSGSAFDQIEVRPNFTQGSAVLKLGQGFDFGALVDRWLIVNKGTTAVSGQVMLSTSGFRNFRISGDVNVLDGGKSRTLQNGAFLGTGFASALASNYSHVMLWNPPGSGKNVIVESFNATSPNGAYIAALIFQNATIGTLQAATVASKLAGGAAGVAQIYKAQQATVPAGTQMISVGGAANAVVTNTFKEPLVIPPGWGVVSAFVNVQGIGNQTGFEWYEE
ncbi:hypothetical protein E2553_33190 [Paraburkholderia dipogonis]|uniref:Uncharacterized protein n=1 Tax=Paraburkholderia dipogonis TaxID=1211383 RepID=A0A4Y8MVE1_9BURK|nr:hypothetical protein [Paraburkholderia dipogonis]TFE41520.1 hypothetical protein E2553_33190 [Paraburkholderia dipogonis]